MATVIAALDTTQRVTLDANAGDSAEITFPTGSKTCLLTFNDNPGRVAYAGTDSAAMATYHQQAAGQTIEWPLPQTGAPILFLGSDTASVKVDVTALSS